MPQMETIETCPECGAKQPDGKTCQDDFNQMLAWEMEFQEALYSVHHLMVLSYHLQHPSLYSPEGLTYAKQLLVDFLEHGMNTQQVRDRGREQVNSSNRKWKVTGTADSHGAYATPVPWSMTAADVTAGGTQGYVRNVQAWAQSIYESLKSSGNL